MFDLQVSSLISIAYYSPDNNDLIPLLSLSEDLKLENQAMCNFLKKKTPSYAKARGCALLPRSPVLTSVNPT